MSDIALIVAMDRQRLIGANNGLPWRLPDDMRWFARHTMGKPVIMGRKTYDSIPAKYKPLSARTNIVVTRNANYKAPGAVVVHSPAEAVRAAAAHVTKAAEIFIGGGSFLFDYFLPAADRLYLTLVEGQYNGDTYFPAFNWLEWRLRFHEDHPQDAGHDAAFSWFIFERVRADPRNDA